MEYFFLILQALTVALCVSADVFIVSLEYAAKKINVSLKAIFVFNLVCSALMIVFMLIGAAFSEFISEKTANYIGFSVLLLVGIWKILEDLIKRVLSRISKSTNIPEFSLLGFSVILSVYSSPQKADFDRSESISITEAAILSTALSIDAVTAGFGGVISGDIHPYIFLICTFVIGFLSWIIGKLIGKKLCETSLPISLLAGVIISALAFFKLWH
jgi:putative sporulation protein YtaF